MGTWTVAGNVTPQVVSVTPDSGSGSSQTFTFRYSDSNGYQNLKYLNGMIRQSQSVTASCYFSAFSAQGRIYLMNDQGTAWLGPIHPGTAETVENSQCRLSGDAAALPPQATMFNSPFR